MTKKYCSSCQKDRDIEGGERVSRNGMVVRWRCKNCAYRAKHRSELPEQLPAELIKPVNKDGE